MQRLVTGFFVVLLAAARISQGATFTTLDFQPTAISDDGLVVVGGTDSEGVRWTELAGMEGLGHLTGGESWSLAYGVSADHSVIVGRVRDDMGNGRGARWTEAAGWERIPTNVNSDDFRPQDISADGSFIVGDAWVGGHWEAFRWSEATGPINLGYLPNGSGEPRLSNAITPDGSVIVGSASVAPDPFPHQRAFRWTQATGMVSIHDLPADHNSTATDISADARVIVGSTYYVDRFLHNYGGGFRWTQETGMARLPVGANAVSGDGSVIVGDNFYWDAQTGSRSLLELFYDTSVLVGWDSLFTTDISADGRVIVGSGRNPERIRENWIVHLDALPGESPVVATPVTSAELSSNYELLSFVAGGATYTQADLIQPTVDEFAGHPFGSFGGSILMPVGESVPAPGNRASLLTHDFRLDTGVIQPAVDPTAATLTFSPPLVNGPGPDLVMFETTDGGVFLLDALPDLLQVQVDGISTVIPGSAWGEAVSTLEVSVYNRVNGSATDIGEIESDSYRHSDNLTAELFGVTIDLDDLGVSPWGQISTFQFGSFAVSEAIDPVLIMGINSAALSPRPGDFNSDGIVDGADFLKWQRGESPNPLSAADLTEWGTQYGAVTSFTSNSSQVPEPSARLTLMLGMAIICAGRRTAASTPKGWGLLRSSTLRAPNSLRRRHNTLTN